MIRSPIYPKILKTFLVCSNDPAVCNFSGWIWSPTLVGVLKCPRCSSYLQKPVS